MLAAATAYRTNQLAAELAATVGNTTRSIAAGRLTGIETPPASMGAQLAALRRQTVKPAPVRAFLSRGTDHKLAPAMPRRAMPAGQIVRHQPAAETASVIAACRQVQAPGPVVVALSAAGAAVR